MHAITASQARSMLRETPVKPPKQPVSDTSAPAPPVAVSISQCHFTGISHRDLAQRTSICANMRTGPRFAIT